MNHQSHHSLLRMPACMILYIGHSAASLNVDIVLSLRNLQVRPKLWIFTAVVLHQPIVVNFPVTPRNSGTILPAISRYINSPHSRSLLRHQSLDHCAIPPNILLSRKKLMKSTELLGSYALIAVGTWVQHECRPPRPSPPSRFW